MVNLTAPVGVLRPSGQVSLRPQVQADIFSPKKPTKNAESLKEPRGTTLDAASVTDVARPHRGGGRVTALPERPVETEQGVENLEPSLIRSPSGDKLVNLTTRFPFGASFTFWLRRGGADRQDLEALGSCSEVVDFWKYWNGIGLDRLPASAILAVFRSPERPRAGPKAPGGKWVICPAADEALSVFEELTLALVGGEFDETRQGAPCGVAFSKSECQVEVWNRCATDSSTAPITAQLRELVGQQVSVEYRPHRVSTGQDDISPKNADTPKRAK